MISPDSLLDANAIRIDCRGVKFDQPVLTVIHNQQPFQFILDDALRRRTTFHAGLFANLSGMSADALSYPREQRLCALFESPVNACYANVPELTRRYSVIYTHQRELLQQGPPFRELMFGTNWMAVRSESDSERCRNAHPEKRSGVSFMGSIQHDNSGAYSLRREVAEYVLGRGDVDCFGKGIREIPGKAEALLPYRFSIAMENAASDFYFSEKLVDCFLAETVPVYYGCPGIGTLFDVRGMICFRNIAELKSILDGLSDEDYEKMRPFVLDNKRKVIDQLWHSHTGLFQRLVRMLPAEICLSNPVRLKGERFAPRLRKVLQTMLRPFVGKDPVNG